MDYFFDFPIISRLSGARKQKLRESLYREPGEGEENPKLVSRCLEVRGLRAARRLYIKYRLECDPQVLNLNNSGGILKPRVD